MGTTATTCHEACTPQGLHDEGGPTPRGRNVARAEAALSSTAVPNDIANKIWSRGSDSDEPAAVVISEDIVRGVEMAAELLSSMPDTDATSSAHPGPAGPTPKGFKDQPLSLGSIARVQQDMWSEIRLQDHQISRILKGDSAGASSNQAGAGDEAAGPASRGISSSSSHCRSPPPGPMANNSISWPSIASIDETDEEDDAEELSRGVQAAAGRFLEDGELMPWEGDRSRRTTPATISKNLAGDLVVVPGRVAPKSPSVRSDAANQLLIQQQALVDSLRQQDAQIRRLLRDAGNVSAPSPGEGFDTPRCPSISPRELTASSTDVRQRGVGKLAKAVDPPVIGISPPP